MKKPKTTIQTRLDLNAHQIIVEEAKMLEELHGGSFSHSDAIRHLKKAQKQAR